MRPGVFKLAYRNLVAGNVGRIAGQPVYALIFGVAIMPFDPNPFHLMPRGRFDHVTP
jgi:hypothetical protein